MTDTREICPSEALATQSINWLAKRITTKIAKIVINTINISFNKYDIEYGQSLLEKSINLWQNIKSIEKWNFWSLYEIIHNYSIITFF